MQKCKFILLIKNTFLTSHLNFMGKSKKIEITFTQKNFK